VHFMKLLIIQFSTSYCHFLLLMCFETYELNVTPTKVYR
jgi:hypothetical protein